jgi:hypothetical protein
MHVKAVNIKLHPMKWYIGTSGIAPMGLLLYRLTLWSKVYFLCLAFHPMILVIGATKFDWWPL